MILIHFSNCLLLTVTLSTKFYGHNSILSRKYWILLKSINSWIFTIHSYWWKRSSSRPCWGFQVRVNPIKIKPILIHLFVSYAWTQFISYTWKFSPCHLTVPIYSTFIVTRFIFATSHTTSTKAGKTDFRGIIPLAEFPDEVGKQSFPLVLPENSTSLISLDPGVAVTSVG